MTNIISNLVLLFLLALLPAILVAQIPDFDATKSSAEQGNASAQFNLGYMYANGEGVPENDVEAVKWYRLAAELGHARAQSSLGTMYANGEGVPENYLTAYVWLSVSAAQGDQYAKDNIDIVKNKLTTDQLAQGQTLAAKCFESNFKDCP
jgi:TPR repeat protein